MQDLSFIGAIADAGIGAVAVGVVGFLFWKFIQLYRDTTDQHRKERNEWRDVIKRGQEDTKMVVDELTSVIRDINNK